jgi:hypothetical protein
VIGRGLALSLDQNGHIGQVFAVPFIKLLKNLKSIGRWGDGNLNRGAVLWWCLVGITACDVLSAPII